MYESFLNKFKINNVALKDFPKAKDVGDLCIFLVSNKSVNHWSMYQFRLGCISTVKIGCIFQRI